MDGLWNNRKDLMDVLKGSIEIKDNNLNIKDANRFRGEAVDKIVYNAVFADSDAVKSLCHWIIWEASLTIGCPSSSIHDYYMARANNKWQNATIPAINLRTLTYDCARIIFKTLHKLNSGSCIFEIAKSEMGYTNQSPQEFTTCVLAAAIREKHQGPVFIQGDHFQANPKNFAKNPKEEIESLKKLIKTSVDAGFYNIDIDTSTLVDLSKPTIDEQQKNNYETAAELTKFIRKVQPNHVNISIGGEIGEVGGKNSTIEELSAYLKGYKSHIDNKLAGMSKISIQTGTTHGGVPLSDGTIADVTLDFDTLENLGKAARENFQIGGVVQHGASTLPENAFNYFPEKQTLEIHLATGFQNIILDSMDFPKKLKEQIYAWLDQNCASEKKPGQTPEQFYYKARKKALGPFKKELWNLTPNTKQALMSELTATFERLFKQLGIPNNKDLINKLVKTFIIHKPMPTEDVRLEKHKQEEIPEGAD